MQKSSLSKSVLDQSYSSLIKAIAICGGICQFANLLKVPHSYVTQWKNRDGRISRYYVLDAEKLTKNKVKRYDLRPDLYKKRGD